MYVARFVFVIQDLWVMMCMLTSGEFVRARVRVLFVLVRFARARACLLLGRAGGARHPFRHHVIGLVRSNFRTRCRVVVCAYALAR